MRIAVDTGGTFTDCVYCADEELRVLKVRSTPSDPGRALLEAVATIAPNGVAEVRHGTTVGTNALLERKGARVAFVTTAGFEDTVAIGRQARPKLYDLLWEQQPPLVGREVCFGVAERIACDGTLLEAVSRAELERVKSAVAASKPESVALSLLFAFANPDNERKVAEALRELDLPVSVSHEILPEFREFERASTLVVNAYLAPVMQRYLGGIASSLEARGTRFQVMQSSGGIISPALAAREPVRTILSGPAGGVIGAMAVARSAGFERILTFDMGGTSTDVALMTAGTSLSTTKEAVLLGMPIATPMLDIHTVGAGGGSLASFDRGGALRVGPESAGADPGPICYGRGELPTVTDANLLLGRFDPGWRLAGSLQLNAERTRERLAILKGPLATVEEFAEGIVRVIDARMAKALRHISIERGHDPRGCVLVSFGGAGPLHAVALARTLAIPRVLVPNFPGALSAYGIFVADFVRDHSRTVMLRPEDKNLELHFGQLEQFAAKELQSEGLRGSISRSVDMRYAGQGYELQVPWSDDVAEQFHRQHEQHYSYSDRARAIEIVNVRTRSIAQTNATPLRRRDAQSSGFAESEEGRVFHDGQWHRAKFYTREGLEPGRRIVGPAVLLEYSATTYLPPESAGQVDAFGNFIIEVHA